MKKKEFYNFLVQFATKLDKLGLHKLASQVDSFLSQEVSGIDSILDIYKDLHILNGSEEVQKKIIAALRSDTRPDTPKCPFGLPIPRACKYAGDIVLDMIPRMVDFGQNRRVYNKERTHVSCPYALQVLDKHTAVRCSYGTINSRIPTWEQYRSSPLYPKLWQGFNIPDIQMNRNYYTYNDFNYYSLY